MALAVVKRARVAAEQGEVRQVLGDGGLAGGVGADQDDVGALGDELQRAQLLDGGAVDLLGPLPVEVAQRLEGAEAGKAQAALQGAALAFALLVVDDAGQPLQVAHLLPVGEQAKEAEPAQRGAPLVIIGSGSSSSFSSSVWIWS